MKVFGAICVNSAGEVLLVRGKQSGKWSFPKGHCKNEETDIQCALRELHEETGLVLEGCYSSYHKLRGAGYFVFAVDGSPRPVVVDSWEIDDAAWFPIAFLDSIDTNVDVSIFRSLMKGQISDGAKALSFLESQEAHRKVNSIRNCMAR
jgi:8-oxo-dGTP pyrophosphatase MutT (NUDIX family)